MIRSMESDIYNINCIYMVRTQKVSIESKWIKKKKKKHYWEIAKSL